MHFNDTSIAVKNFNLDFFNTKFIKSPIIKKWRNKKDYLNDLEELKIQRNRIIQLGKKVKKIKNIDGRFVGITKFSKKIISKIINENVMHKFNPKFLRVIYIK